MSNLIQAPALKAYEAVAPHPDMSSRYRFVSTQALIERLEALGWSVDKITAPRHTRTQNQYSAHLVSMRNPSLPLYGDSEARIWLLNSHDGTRALSFSIGYFRLICENGLIAPIKAFQLKARHVGNINQLVSNAVESFHIALPELVRTREALIARQLSQREIANFAVQASQVITNIRGVMPSTVMDLIKVSRPEDQSDDAWTVFNRIQERAVGSYDGLKTIQVEGQATQVVSARTQPLRNAGQFKDLNEQLFSLALKIGGVS